MIDGTSALKTQESVQSSIKDIVWTNDQYAWIVSQLLEHGCEYLKGREEYTLLKEIVVSNSLTEDTNFRQKRIGPKPVVSRAEGSGVISPCVCDREK